MKITSLLSIYTYIFFGIVTVLASAIDINNCSTLWIPEKTYILTNDVSTNETTCFTITAKNIVLDCDGFSINIINNTNNRGIYSDQPNTIIKNCNMPLTTQDNEVKYTKKALFDIISEIVTEPKNPGEDLIVKISLINFGASATIDANLEYTITDSNEQIIRQYTKTVPVTTQIEFLDRINTQGLAKGRYTLKIGLVYEGQSFPAQTEKVFYVGLTRGWFRSPNIKISLLSSITIILFIGIYIKSRRNKQKEEKYS